MSALSSTVSIFVVSRNQVVTKEADVREVFRNNKFLQFELMVE